MTKSITEFLELQTKLPEEQSNPELLHQFGTSPEMAHETLVEWGISDKVAGDILSGDFEGLIGLQKKLRPDVIVAYAVIASGNQPRLHGAVTMAVRAIIDHSAE